MRYDIDLIKKESIGKWGGIIQSLGIEIPMPYGNHGKCPIENDGRDRFRVDKNFNEHGSYFCNQCSPQSGDGISLIQRVFGCTFIESIQKIGDIIGTVEFEPTPTQEDESKKRERMNNLWKSSKPIDGSDGASKYLRGRGIVIGADPKQVRYCTNCMEPETMSTMPAMVAMIRDNLSNTPIGMHRTYLTSDHKKADINSPKKSLGKTANGSIQLMPCTDTLGVAEGIETALAASQLFSIPVWSAIDAGGLEAFYPPEGVHKVVIFGDNDANFTGQKSAYRLANKLYLKEFNVDEPQIPTVRGDDWADVLRKNMTK